VRKCPYCDFNSHEAKSSLPEELYVRALLTELTSYLPMLNERPVVSIFFGGGTPSLFSPASIKQILKGVAERLTLTPDCEITLEANPGASDQERFEGFREAGVNRLSIGIQSLHNHHLKTLGRIHDRDYAIQAIEYAKQAGFSNFNLDIMFGLPQQTLDEALQDIDAALAFTPSHFSWYQLTIEPNTLFHHQPPALPPDDALWEMQLAGQSRIAAHGLHQYEVSAYARENTECVHNRNYWEFGDYLGIGAGAHSKLSAFLDDQFIVQRFAQIKHPRDYLDVNRRRVPEKMMIDGKSLVFEFMLNALRLTSGVSTALFIERTGLSLEQLYPQLALAKQRGLLLDDAAVVCPSELGKRFLNDLIELFL
jgi:oxygen-independent coproporphyrinogen-3 oxidase